MATYGIDIITGLPYLIASDTGTTVGEVPTATTSSYDYGIDILTNEPYINATEAELAGTLSFIGTGSTTVTRDNNEITIYSEVGTGGTGEVIQGEQGIQGIQGIQGEQGLKGDKGDKGDKGEQGIQGIQGLKGDTGIQGIQGVKGDTGDTGTNGIQGIQGIQGLIGLTGATGATGLQGIQGIKGDTGAAGTNGIQGIQGVKGDKGDTGAAGANGTNGIDGINGLDLYKHYTVLGSNIKAFPLCTQRWYAGTASNTAYVKGALCYLDADSTLTGIKFILVTSGVYTATNFNGVALYKLDSPYTTATLVASSIDTPNAWKATANTLVNVDFSDTYNATAGYYFLATIVNGTITTAPQFYNANEQVMVLSDIMGGTVRLGFAMGSQLSFPSTINLSGTSKVSYVPGYLLY